jgi:hypothetical protein
MTGRSRVEKIATFSYLSACLPAVNFRPLSGVVRKVVFSLYFELICAKIAAC